MLTEGLLIDSEDFEQFFIFYNSLVEHYPQFERILRESLRLIVGEDVEARVDIGLAKDGSGVGGEC